MNYLYYKLIHILAVVIFLGNIITGLYWMRMAVKTKDLKIISHTMKYLIKADRYFTIPGVVIITTFGLLAAISGHFPILHSGRILWSIILFTISGLAFGFKVAPLQKEIFNLAAIDESSSDFHWVNFNQVYVRWDICIINTSWCISNDDIKDSAIEKQICQ